MNNRPCPFEVGDVVICYQQRRAEGLVERKKDYKILVIREVVAPTKNWMLTLEGEAQEYPAWHFCKKRETND